MANTRKTKKDFFNEILTNYDLTDAHREFVEKQIAQLDKKASGNRKPTKTQIANEGIKATIVEGMAADTEYTITDLIKTIEDIADYSNQKISNLVGQLVKAGTVVRREEKGRAYFKLA